MDIIYIFNGLGNQMSQYGLFLAKKRINTNVKFFCQDNDHNGYELDRVFNITSKRKFNRILSFLKKIALYTHNNTFVLLFRRILMRLGISFIVETTDYKFKQEVVDSGRKLLNIYIGGWHNYKYYKNLNLKEIYKFNLELLNPPSKEYLCQILERNSVAIHIRRGDYILEENLQSFGGICNLQYYTKAIDYIRQLITSPHFFVFSNDELWVKKNLILDNMTIVNCNTHTNSWMDMCLMSKCKNIIIANSTFSWWGAYLSDAKIIIRPSSFNRNPLSKSIYPPEWIALN